MKWMINSNDQHSMITLRVQKRHITLAITNSSVMDLNPTHQKRNYPGTENLVNYLELGKAWIMENCLLTKLAYPLTTFSIFVLISLLLTKETSLLT